MTSMIFNNKATPLASTPRLRSLRRRRGYQVMYAHSSPTHTRCAFSLIEVLLAIVILGIGVIGIAALFPAGIVQQQRSNDDIMGPLVANNALEILRTKLNQDDFGSYEEFDLNSNGFLDDYPPEFEFVGTVVGDWLWRRPAVMYGDDPDTLTRDERGAIDIFGFVNTPLDPAIQQGNSSLDDVPSASDEESYLGSTRLRSIPFNRQKHLIDIDPPDWDTPSIVFTRAERMFPMGDKVRGVGFDEKGQYYWDCMFRRFQGRILVAIFVYRVNTPPGEVFIYSTVAHPDATGVPIIPFHRSFVDVTSEPPWTDALDAAEFSTTFGDYDIYEIPQTDPDTALLAPEAVPSNTVRTVFEYNWQATGQWFIDQNNNVHRVLAGRDRVFDEPVKLVSPIPVMQSPTPDASFPLPNNFGSSAFFYDRIPANNPVGVENIITHIWYIPTSVLIDINEDGTTNEEDAPITLTPVYVTVEEL